MADPLPSLPDTAGISEEDRRDIVAQIDRVAQENRIQAGPQLFLLKPRKKGFVVPLAVNLGALAVLVLGVGALWLLFRQNADTLVRNQVVLQSPEGRLIEELRKESQGQLLAKDQEIADMQKRLADVNKAKSDLQANMDAKIAAREAELKKQLQEALQAERDRLTQAGYSQAVVEERLKTFEKQKTAEFQKQLDDFRKKADLDRVALENDLKKQQDEFQKNINSLAGERLKIQEDARKKQGELQAQLDQKTHDLETQQSASKAQLAQAQQQLSDLNEQRTRAEAVDNQLQGLYIKAAQSIQTRQYGEALKQVQGLVTFLNDPAIKAMPSVQKRRDADLLLANTLSDWLIQDQRRADADAVRLQNTQDAVDTIQILAAQAQQALAAGRNDEAETLFKKALAEIPAVLESHQYFLNKALQVEQTKQALVAEALTRGDAALAAGKAADALKAYNTALDGFSLKPEERSAFAGHWGQAFFDTELTTRQADLDTALKKDLATAQGLIVAAPARALAAYVSILSKYPVGQAGFASLAGIRQAGAQLQGPSAKETALTAELAQVKADLAQANANLAQTKDQLAAAQKAPIATAPTTEGNTAGADLAALKAARAEADKLRPDAVALKAMSAQFQDFLTRDAPLWATTPSSSQMLQSKLLLNSFLASPEVSKTFPGLADKMSRYEKNFLEAGQKEGMINIGDAVANLSQLRTTAERKQYLTTLQRRYAGNTAMTDVIKNLQALY